MSGRSSSGPHATVAWPASFSTIRTCRGQNRTHDLRLHRLWILHAPVGRPLPELRRLEHPRRRGGRAQRTAAGQRPGHARRADHRGDGAGGRPPPDRCGRAGPGTRRWPGGRLGGAAGGRAGHRQVHPAARRPGAAGGRGAGALRVRGGVAGAGPPAGRAPRRAPSRAVPGGRDRPRHGADADRADRAACGGGRLRADGRRPGAGRRAGRGRPGPRGRRAARPAGQGPGHRDLPGRPGHQGWRGGRAQDARAPGGRGAVVRGGPAPRAAAGPLHQEPLRPGLRGRLLRDDRGWAGAARRPVAPVPVRPRGGRARGRLHRERGGAQAAGDRGPGAGLADRTGDPAAHGAGPRPGPPGHPDRGAGAAGTGVLRRPRRVRGDRRRGAPHRASGRPGGLPGPGLGRARLARARRPGGLRRGRARRRGASDPAARPPPGRGEPPGLPAGPGPDRRPRQGRRHGHHPDRVGLRSPVRRRRRRRPPTPAPRRRWEGAVTSADGTGERLDGEMLGMLRLVAPGTVLRQGLERILRAETGALIVLGAPAGVQALFTGGFRIHVPYTAQRLSELAKMDGALVLDGDAHQLLWANVHLMPDPSVPTVETGTRHRTAERVARQSGVPVVAVSESMRTVTLYVGGWRHVVDEVGTVLSRANQAVQSLQHYRARFDEASAALDALELQGHATLRAVLNLVCRAEMVRRVAGEVERYVAELGVDGRLLRLQLDDLTGNPDTLDVVVVPRGYRLLSKVPGLPAPVITRVVERFGSLKVILAAGVEDLEEVVGVGPGRARNLREGLMRLAEASASEHY